MGSLRKGAAIFFPGEWQAYPASLKLACAGAGSSLLMCCYGDLAKVASKNRKGGLMLSYPENDLGNSLSEVRRIGPRSTLAKPNTHSAYV